LPRPMADTGSGMTDELNWSTLGEYARAAAEFTSTPATALPRDSFARLAAMDLSGLPAHAVFTADDGCELAYRRYAAREGDAGTVIALIHGAGGYGGQLHALAAGISASARTPVYTLDMRGHGLSGGKPGHAVSSPRQMCDDITAFLRFLEGDMPGARIILGGHSAGGGLVLRFCRSPAANRLGGCILLAPYLGLGSPTIRPLFGGWVRVHANRLRAVTLATALGIRWFNNTTVVAFDLTACPNRDSYTSSWSFNTVLAMGPGRWAPRTAAVSGSYPVLVIFGSRDECFYAQAYPEAFRIVAPRAEVRTIEGIGHWDLLVDPHTPAIVSEWLSRIGEA
jgi:non-heme chloroperoxidase